MGTIYVNVKLFATLRNYFPDYKPEKGIEVPMMEGATVENLIDTLQLPRNEARVVFANGISMKITDLIHHGDEIKIFTPLGGG